MRTTQLFFRTFKEAPHEADILSHQLLERGGLIRRAGRGLYIYTPLMWRILKKILVIIREEMDRAGCQEVSFPHLHPASLWESSGRWGEFSAERLLYTLEDREGHPYCLAPTHEEMAVHLVSDWVTSYKQLPLNLYQIGSKFRDEIRPRFGLMRSKEFLMKDGYSFSSDEKGMEEQYRNMRQAYSNVFDRLGLTYVIVEAHGGKIGRGKSEEFQVTADVGEDAVMVCGTYAANVEATIAIAPPFVYDAEQKPKKEIPTPNTTSIEALTALTKLPPQQILKTVLYKLQFADRNEVVAICIRGDRQVNEVKVMTHFGAIDIQMLTDEEVEKVTGTKVGFAGPLEAKVATYFDETTAPMTNFLSAANKPDVHFENVNFGRDLEKPPFHDFLLAEEGDGCPFEAGGTYTVQRGIEVGHIFNIGTKYPEKMGVHFQDESGKMRPFWMGTYGIGVGRLASACVEQSHDDRGIIWPLEIAPFHVTITAAAMNNPAQVEVAEKLYAEAQAAGIEALLDDRPERLGFKLRDSDLLGMPLKVIVGKAFDGEGKIEIETRQGAKQLVAQDDVVAALQRALQPA